MLFYSLEDFCEKAALCRRASRQEELEYAGEMRTGDPDTRQALIDSYTPMVVAHIQRLQ